MVDIFDHMRLAVTVNRSDDMFAMYAIQSPIQLDISNVIEMPEIRLATATFWLNLTALLLFKLTQAKVEESLNYITTSS